MPDWVSNLISALKLSGRIIAGLFLACLVALALNGLGVIQLAGISVLALPLIILAAVLFDPRCPCRSDVFAARAVAAHARAWRDQVIAPGRG
jgi:hypothetical protein